MDESDLIRKAQEGDQDAYADLFGLYQPRIVNAAEKILGNEADAEEIAPDVFMKGIEAYLPVKGTRFDTWLLGKITSNACIDRTRRSKAKKRGGRDEGDDEKLTAKPTLPLDQNKAGERDLHLQILIAQEADPHVLARRKIESWPDDTRRKHALRIVTDERIASFTEELKRTVEKKGTVTMSHFILILKWAAECSEPWKEPFTPEEARATVKVLGYFGANFRGAPAGSGFEAIPEAAEILLRLLHPIANRKGTKTAIYQYDLINRLDHLLLKICGPRLPDTAIRILLGITYGGKWTAGKLAGMRNRAREVFPT